MAARRGVDESYKALSDAESAYSDAKSAVGITKEIENIIARSDSFGGEQAILKKADLHSKKRVQSVVCTVLFGALAIASLLFLLLAGGALGGRGRL